MTGGRDVTETWYILEADTIHGMLYRARYERTEPDMLMLKLSAMSNTVTVEDDDG
jgi:hypothetical protein